MERNKKQTSKLEYAITKTLKSVAAGKLDDAKTWLKTSQQLLDKAAGKGLIKKNNAARRLSRLSSKVNAPIKK